MYNFVIVKLKSLQAEIINTHYTSLQHRGHAPYVHKGSAYEYMQSAFSEMFYSELEKEVRQQGIDNVHKLKIAFFHLVLPNFKRWAQNERD